MTVYVGVSGYAKKLSKFYVSVEGKAKKVSKAYIGINGVAKKIFSSEPTIEYIGTISALSSVREHLGATSIGNYALFGGGYTTSTYSATVDAYNASLVRTTPTALSLARGYLSATSIGNYALFGGGYTKNSFSATVDAYNTSLVRTTPTALSSAREHLSAAFVGNYALFGGGVNKAESANNVTTFFVSNIVDAYNTSLVRTTPTALSLARGYLSATSVGKYALFGGGKATYIDSLPEELGDSLDTVDAYNTSLVRTTPTALSSARECLSAAFVGNYALFGGGYTKSGEKLTDVMDAYQTTD